MQLTGRSGQGVGGLRAFLLQFRVLCLGLFQYGNIRICILPDCKEILIGGASLGEGGGIWRALSGLNSRVKGCFHGCYAGFKSERTSEFEMRHSAIGYNSMCSAMIDELLKF